MKKILFTLALLLPILAHAQQEVKTDSLSATLEEVQVTADAQIETAKKVILRPTILEKKHSTNGYSLLENMNLPDFNVNASAKTISTISGREVKLLINGVEVDPDELATLAAYDIVQIDYQRNPGGRYVGSGAVMNFITKQYDYGGNVYLSADEGLARQYGNYIGMVNYKHNAVTLTLTANGQWDHNSTLNYSDNTVMLNDGTLFQNINPLSANTHTNSQYFKFKFTHSAGNHTLDLAALFKRNAIPTNLFTENMIYSGIRNFASQVTRCSHERGIMPVIGVRYNLFLPGGHTLMMSGEVSHGHTNYQSIRSESGFDDLINNTVENNLKAGGNVTYFKSLPHNLSLGVSVDEFYNYFHDVYSGNFDSKQTLTNNHAMIMFHADQSLPIGISYYASFGLTDLYSTIGEHHDNQFAPMAFYGVTYAINQKHTLSVTGNYAHSIYNPSFKNDAVIQTSFFEATMGNPELEQLNGFQNFVSYNGRIGHFGLSFTYDFLKYFDNTSNRYFAEDNVMYHQLINDGNFSYNKLVFGLSANLLGNKLRLKGNATFSMNRFDSKYRPEKSNDWRADFSATYMFGEWEVKGVYALPYNVLDIEGTKIHNPAQYGLFLNWQHGNWAAECCVENFLDRRLATRTNANFGVYHSVSESLSNLRGRNISVSVTYTLPYGKKTDRDRIETESKVNSAILRPF